MLKLRMNSVIQQQTNNSSSNYCKMPDGTLMQWGTINVTLVNSGGFVPYSGGTRFNFEIPFLEGTTPIVISDPLENGGYWNSGTLEITYYSCHISLGGNQSGTKPVSYIAIGRWK